MVKVSHQKGPARKYLEQIIKDAESKKIAVGFFDTATYADGTPVAQVAAIQEFGSGPIPPRSFMRTTENANKKEWSNQIRKGLKAAVSGKATVDVVYGQVGQLIAGQVKAKISSITTPPLSPATIAARKSKRKGSGVSTKPLVDSGVMIQSVESKVISK